MERHAGVVGAGTVCAGTVRHKGSMCVLYVVVILMVGYWIVEQQSIDSIAWIAGVGKRKDLRGCIWYVSGTKREVTGMRTCFDTHRQEATEINYHLLFGVILQQLWTRGIWLSCNLFNKKKRKLCKMTVLRFFIFRSRRRRYQRQAETTRKPDKIIGYGNMTIAKPV